MSTFALSARTVKQNVLVLKRIVSAYSDLKVPGE